MHRLNAPTIQTSHRGLCVQATIHGLRRQIAGLAPQSRFAQQCKPLAMPRRIPAQRRWPDQNHSWRATGGSDVHGTRMVADKQFRPCDHAHKFIQRARLHSIHRIAQSGVITLNNPTHHMRFREPICQLDEVPHRPALILPARAGMNHDRARFIAAKRAQIRRRHDLWQCKLHSGNPPIMRSHRHARIHRCAMSQQAIQLHMRRLRAEATRGPAQSRQQMRHVSLIVSEQADLRLQSTKLRRHPHQTPRLTPCAIEFRCFHHAQLDLRAADLIQARGHRTRKHHDVPIRMCCRERLHDGQEHDVVAELVYFENEQRHAGKPYHHA